MFTGIVSHVGLVRSLERSGDGMRARVAPGREFGPCRPGASVACAGVCLTVAASDPEGFDADVSAETLCAHHAERLAPGHANQSRTPRCGWATSSAGTSSSGMWTASPRSSRPSPEGDSRRIAVEAPQRLAPLIAEKGSVTLDGVALTVNEVDGSRFVVNLIPHTAGATTLGAAVAGTRLTSRSTRWPLHGAPRRLRSAPMTGEQVAPVEAILDDVRRGRMVVLVDDERRENEGDLVIPAERADAGAVNFMARYGRGLICLALTQERADRLRLR